ncbi:MAG: hypothetical protein R3F49_20305 [Planctomycetota bacterium]
MFVRTPQIPSAAAQRGRGLGGLLVAVAILGAVAFFGLRRSLEPKAPELTLSERYEADARLVPILFPCGEGRPFTGDTSAMIDVLVSKLDAGAQLEPLRRAKQELARLGPEVERPLRRLFDDASRDMWRVPVVMNVLEVCALAEQPWGLDIGLTGIVSAREDVRAKASYVLRKHGRPEDYPALRDALWASGAPETASKFALAMKACDPGLFHYEVADFIDRTRSEPNGLSLSTLTDTLTVECVDAVDPIVIDKLYERSVGLAPRHRAYMIAPAAASAESKHSAAALEELRAMVRDPLVGPRQNASTALMRAGLAQEVLPVLELDADARLRAVAATLVANAIVDGTLDRELGVVALRRGLNDADPSVQVECLAGLLRLGDDVAWVEAVRRLEGSIGDRDIAVRTLRPAWDRLPAGAPEQARARLAQLWTRRSGEGAPSDELMSVISALGAVPGRATAEFLLPIAEQLAGTTVRGIDGHLWVLGQIYNAGPEARAVLRERLAGETEPFRRLDLIFYIWQDEDPAAIEVLLEAFTDATRSPYERLYVAERLLNMRATTRIAPILKSVYWESTDPILRPGLQCLLWIWYGVST